MTGRDPDLDSELAAARLDAAADARRRRHGESEFAAMETTLVSVLAGAAATAELVTVETVDGALHRGRVDGIGDDVVMVVREDMRRVFVRLTAVAFVRRSAAGLVDERSSTRGSTTMHEVVAGLAGTRAVATFVCRGGATVSGEVVWCGEDAAGVRSPGDHSNETVIYVASLSEVTSAGASSSP